MSLINEEKYVDILKFIGKGGLNYRENAEASTV